MRAGGSRRLSVAEEEAGEGAEEQVGGVLVAVEERNEEEESVSGGDRAQLRRDGHGSRRHVSRPWQSAR